MFKNHWNAFHIYLFGQTQTTRQTLNPENLENKSNFEGWGLTLVAYKRVLTKTLFYDCSK